MTTDPLALAIIERQERLGWRLYERQRKRRGLPVNRSEDQERERPLADAPGEAREEERQA